MGAGPRALEAARRLLAVALPALALFLAAPAPALRAAEGPKGGPPLGWPLSETPHPGRGEALRLAGEGNAALRAGEIATARALLAEALIHDPLLAAAWINLAAAHLARCDPGAARAAAFAGRTLAPNEPAGAANLRLALQLSCDEPPPPSERSISDEEIAAWDAQVDPALFVAAAEARRARGERLVAAFFEGRARALGAPAAESAGRAAADLEAAGLLARAVGLYEEAGADRQAARVRALRAPLFAPARRLAAELAPEAGLEEGPARDGLFTLAETLLARGLALEEARVRLGALLGLGQPTPTAGAFGRALLPPGWARLDTAVAAGAAPGDVRQAPALVARRFPGDTQLALYEWPRVGAAAALDAKREDAAAAARADALARALAELGALPAEEERACPAPEGLACRARTLTIDGGLAGPLELDARLLGQPGAPPALLALGLVGDAGCGAPCREEAQAELEALLASLEPAPALLARGTTPATSGDEASALSFPLPAAFRGEEERDEEQSPWRAQPLGEGLLIDLPPGFVPGRVEGSFRDRNAGPATRLWMRGSFRDLDGVFVRVGNERFAGTVDVYASGGARIAAPSAPPRRDPGASLRRALPLDEILAQSEGGARRGRVALFEGQAFAGLWLVQQLLIGGELVEIALPVVEGAESASLLWMALTLRREDERPPTPPVDLSAAFDVDFRRFENASPADPREGILRAGSLRLAVPRDFRVSVSGRSRGGFPLTLRASEGGARVLIEALAGARAEELERVTRRQEALEGASEPVSWARVREDRRGVVLRARFGARVVFLALPRDEDENEGYRVALELPASFDDERAAHLAGVLADSLRLVRR